MPVTVGYEVEQQIKLTLHRYCETIDTADFDAFAALFERGRWFMVSQPGSQPVRDWLDEYIVLYDGHTYTRHEISNLSIQPTDSPDEVAFNCYVTIWQDLPGEPPKLLAHARFDGSFQRSGETWWWYTHALTVQYAGDLSGHIKGGLG